MVFLQVSRFGNISGRRQKTGPVCSPCLHHLVVFTTIGNCFAARVLAVHDTCCAVRTLVRTAVDNVPLFRNTNVVKDNSSKTKRYTFSSPRPTHDISRNSNIQLRRQDCLGIWKNIPSSGHLSDLLTVPVSTRVLQSHREHFANATMLCAMGTKKQVLHRIPLPMAFHKQQDHR